MRLNFSTFSGSRSITILDGVIPRIGEYVTLKGDSYYLSGTVKEVIYTYDDDELDSVAIHLEG